MLEPKDKNGNCFIIEFKVLDNLLEATIEETIKNVKKKNCWKKYEENLLERGFDNITKMVFAFKGKEVKLEVLMVYNMVCEFYSHTILYTILLPDFSGQFYSFM